jgi:hypothetical protein
VNPALTLHVLPLKHLPLLPKKTLIFLHKFQQIRHFKGPFFAAVKSLLDSALKTKSGTNLIDHTNQFYITLDPLKNIN